MSIEVSWLDEAQSAIVYRCSPHWTWAEFSEQDKRADLMMQTAGHPIDVIVDFTGIDTFPPNALSSFQYYAKNKSANRRHIIVVGDHPLFKTLANNFATLAQRMHQEIYIVATFDEARRLVSEGNQTSNE